MKPSGKLPVLYQHFLNKESTPEELQDLFRLFDTTSEAELTLLIEQAVADVSDKTLPERTEKLQALFTDITHRINTGNSRNGKIIRLWRISVSIAAAMFIGIGCYMWFGAKSPVIKTVYAAYGKSIKITLPDSSHVWLNGGTTLQYPESFSKNKREISLKNGDIFFDVTHIDHCPFIVHTRANTVQVLGTSFEISAFEKDKNSKVSVLSGKVGVLPDNKKNGVAFLLPGEQAIIDHATHAVQKIKIDTADIAAWRSGRLIFEEQPFAEVMESLERTYNVQIRIENKSLLDKQVTMRLNHQPLNNVLTAISFSHHFSYMKINDQLIIVK